VTLFLVERFLPSMSAAEVSAASARLAAGEGVRHLWTVLVAAEETCLSLFEGADARAVEAANRRAGFPFDRVVEATAIEPA